MKKTKKIISKLVTSVLLTSLTMALLTGCGDTGANSNESTPSNSESSSEGDVSSSSESENDENSNSKSNQYGVITYAIGTSWNTINPWYNAPSACTLAVIGKIYDDFGVISKEGEVDKRAAESLDISEDGKTVTVHLRENSIWHDGEPVTADDWVWTLETIASEEIAYGTKSFINILAGTDSAGNAVEGEEFGAKKVDDYTLEIDLKDATNDIGFFASTKYWYVLPKHLLEDIAVTDLENADFWAAPVGSGPCVFDSEISGQEITLLPNEDYYLGAPKFSKLIYKVIDPSNFVSSLLVGEIDAFYPSISIDEAKELEGQDGINVQKDTQNTTFYYSAINNKKYDIKVRQAINYAIDKQLLVDQLLQGEGVPGGGMTALGSRYNKAPEYGGRDVEKAKELLKEAGWVDGTTLQCVASDGVREKIAVILQQNLAEVGINVEIVNLDATTALAGLRDGTYDMGAISYPGTAYPPTAKSLYNPDANTPSNIVDYSVADKFNEINAQQDEAERLKLAEELAQIVDEQQNNLILFHQYNYFITSDRVSNVASLEYENVWQWEVEGN